MAKRAPHSFVLLFTTSVTLVLTRAVVGCASDAGGAHGGDFGTLPELDGGRRVLLDGGILEPDGAVVAPDDDDDTGIPEPVCNGGGTAAVVAGGTAALTGAVKVGGSRWLAATITGGAAKSKPSLVALGTGFIGVTQGADDSLEALSYTETWAPATAFGVGGVKGSPTLAVTGTTAHVVYSAGANDLHNYMHGVYDGTSWNAATELVAVNQNDPSTSSFGTVSAGLASVGNGTGLAFAENGSNNGLYARLWSSGTSWGAATAVDGAGSVGANGATPEVVAVTGTYDAILIYADNNAAVAGGAPIAWASHVADAAAWGTPNQPPHEIGAGAATNEKMAAAALTGTSIVVSFRANKNAYYTVGIVSDTGVTWSAVAPVGGGAPIAVDAVAAVAKGICGADIMFAYSVAGTVQTVSLTGTTWSTPETINGAAGSNVAIATIPQ